MKDTDLWQIEKIHVKSAYNDDDNYAILNATEKIIATSYDWSKPNDIVNAHNRCFIEMAKEKPAVLQNDEPNQ